MRRPSFGVVGVMLGALFAVVLLVADHAGAQAVGWTDLGGCADTGTTVDYTCGSSITFDGGELVLATVLTNAGDHAVAAEVTCTGLTFVEVEREYLSTTERLSVLRGVPATGGSCTPVIGDAGTGSVHGHMIARFAQISNADVSGADGENAIVQVAKSVSSGSVNPHTVTLGAFADPYNATFGAFAEIANGLFTPGSGFSNMGGGQIGSPNGGLGTQFKATNDTTVEMSSGFTAQKMGIAIEIKSASGVPPTTTGAPTTTTTAPGGGGGVSCSAEDECVVSLDDDTSSFVVAVGCTVVFLGAASLVGSWRRA